MEQKIAFNRYVYDPKHATNRTAYGVSYHALNLAVRLKDGSLGIPVCFA
jgi:hypothetical protein